jgi:hypothetical protein
MPSITCGQTGGQKDGQTRGPKLVKGVQVLDADRRSDGGVVKRRSNLLVICWPNAGQNLIWSKPDLVKT